MSEKREPTNEDVLRRLDELGATLTTRIDRMQDALAAQRDDVTVLLDLLVTNQRMAERGFSEARLALDMRSSTATTLATLERQIRRLEKDVRELRGGS